MINFRSILLSIVLMLGLLSSANAGEEGPGVDETVPGRAIVRTTPNGSIDQFLELFNADHPEVDAVAIDVIPGFDTHLIAFRESTPGDIEGDLEENYPAAGHLAWGELLWQGSAPEGKTGSTWVGHAVDSVEFSDQYATTLLNLNTAHAFSTGLGTVIAVLDTGIDASHPQFANRIVAGGYNYIALNGDTGDAGDEIDNDGDGAFDEMAGHGTYVAGLIALVAPDAKLLPVTVLNSDGIGDVWAFARGLHYAVNQGVEVINMSLGSTYESRAVLDALEYAKSKGIIAVAAAGNFDRDDPREFPAMSDTEDSPDGDEFLLFGVAATDHQDVKADFSNYHKNLFISAPGNTITDTQGAPVMAQSIISAIPGGGYRAWEGTSMATALVSGSVALVRSQHPEWPATVQTFHNVRSVFTSSADDIYGQNPGYEDDAELGVGRVNAGAAAALGPVAPGLADLNADGSVNVLDLLKVIADWGLIHSSADINGDGTVNVLDLLLVFSNWG